MKNTEPLVSVVIPTYNRRLLLERALKSVWIQDFRDMEIIVVDDGSTDDTCDYLRELKKEDVRFRPIFHEKNKGEAGARNTGVKNSLGKYIAFLDSDDEWLPGKIQAQVELMETCDDTVGACCTGQFIVDENGNESIIHDWSNHDEITDRNLLIKGCGVGMGNTFFIRQALFEEVGYFDESLPLLVDLDWLCRLTSKYSVLKIKKPLIVYNKAPMRPATPMLIARAEFYSKNKDYLNSFGIIDRMAILSRFYGYISISYHAHGQRWRYVFAQLIFLVCNPYQSPKQYIYFLAILLGLQSCGKNDK